MNTVRCPKSLATTAALTLLTSCTTTPPRPTFNPTPKPTHPGQVVIIAGDHRIDRDPRDGELALRTSAYTDGGLAVSESGAVYFQVGYRDEGRIARIEPDGRVTLMKLGNIPDQLAMYGDDLWLMSSHTGMDLVRASPRTLRQRIYLAWNSALGNAVKVADPASRSNVRDEWQVRSGWKGARFGIRADGTPVVVARAGGLFLVQRENLLTAWRPVGYAAALRKAAGGREFSPAGVVGDGDGGLVILGRRGLVRLPRAGVATGVRFPSSTDKLPPWSVVVATAGGSLLLLGAPTGVERSPRPVMVRPDGSMQELAWGGPKRCEQFDGSLAVVASADPVGLSARPDGTLFLSDRSCGRVYAFRLPKGIF